jgi:hypothetical protein
LGKINTKAYRIKELNIMAGNLNSDSVIWVVGEATGVSGKGVYGASIPGDEDAAGAATQAELDVLEARLVASGILASGI